jgi:hypothetical protein
MKRFGFLPRSFRDATILIASAFAAVPSSAVELKLAYTSTEDRVTTMQPAAAQEQGGPGVAATQRPKPRTEHQADQLSVFLGDDYFAEVHADSSNAIDFGSKRILTLSAGKKEWTSASLFSDLGFRLMEYQNRVMLGHMLSAAKADDPAIAAMGDPFELETLFSLRFPNDRAKPVTGLTRELLSDGSFSFRRNGEELVDFKASSSQVPDQFKEIYALWLVYRSRIHPQIRSEICKEGVFPAVLRTHWRNTGETGITTIVLENAEVIDGSPHRPKAEAADTVAEGPLLRVVLASRDQNLLKARPTLESAVVIADQATTGGRPLGGILALLEIGLQDGTDIAPATQQLRSKFQQDQECARFFAALKQSNKAECEAGLKTLREIDRANLAKDYILDVHIGDHLSSLGKTNEARVAFLSVLEQNPFIAGVWNDLGQLYFREYDMPKAWLCWDTARSLCPSHPMLKAVSEYEARIENDFPEFFMRI